MKKITDKVSWVGKVDWELRRFHGDEYSTEKGSSYNAYLIRDKKTALIDTVWGPYDKEYVKHLKEDIDLSTVDYIIMDHSESDHSGALPELMREIPDVPIYCTQKGEAIIRGHYHKDWNFVTVKTGDSLCLGETTSRHLSCTGPIPCSLTLRARTCFSRAMPSDSTMLRNRCWTWMPG